MLGYGDVAKTKSWWEELAKQIDDIVGEALNPIRWVVNTIKDKLAEFVEGAIRDATGIDIDPLSDFLPHAVTLDVRHGRRAPHDAEDGKTSSGKQKIWIIKAPELYSKASAIVST